MVLLKILYEMSMIDRIGFQSW